MRGRIGTSLLVLLALGACSNDDGSGSDSATTVVMVTAPPTAAPTTTQPPADVSTTAGSTTSTLELFTTGESVASRQSQPVVGERIPLAPTISADQPVAIEFRPGTGTAFVVERSGRVRRLVDGALSDPVLDLTNEVDAEAEWGFLGMAFSPDGAFVYINETDGYVTRIHEFAVLADETFATESDRIVYQFDQPGEGHKGGDLLFGPDGYLYIPIGDGGTPRDIDDPLYNDGRRVALSLVTPLGKMLRIDPQPSDTAAFTVPADNPFVDVPDALPEIWSVGLRNPWRVAFDPATGDLWIGDVGSFDIEEIDWVAAVDGKDAAKGISFGWSAWEGTRRLNTDQPAAGHLIPVYEFVHGPLGCSVVGGEVYHGTQFPELENLYVFGDYCSGEVWTLDPKHPTEPVRSIANLPYLVDITADLDGELHLVSVVDGVTRLVVA
ncbi:MAG: PQQ-dependent sugar dehydrogenase [Actinomycetia bacterium]|nr:PQQ-dependent sugar dehydrogenase [Actinomycetes bacterium]